MGKLQYFWEAARVVQRRVENNFCQIVYHNMGFCLIVDKVAFDIICVIL